MRRTDRQRDAGFALEIIDRCAYGVAAMTAADGTPYCIPLSLVRLGEFLYFHCAMEGTKVDLLRRDPRVCISFVGANQAAQDDFTTYFQSACVEGEASEVLDQEEKIRALRALCEKLTPAHMTENNFERAMERSLARTGVWKIRIRSLTGKEKPRP